MRIVTWNVASLVRGVWGAHGCQQAPFHARTPGLADCDRARSVAHAHCLRRRPLIPFPPLLLAKPPTARNIALAHGSLAAFFKKELAADVIALQEVRAERAPGAADPGAASNSGLAFFN
jgi:hypothetical protein